MFSLFEMLSDQMDENSICHLLEYTKEKFNQFQSLKPPSYETNLESSYYNFESVLFSESYHNGGQVFYLNPPIYNLSIQINSADQMYYYCASVWSIMEGCYFEMYGIREVLISIYYISSLFSNPKQNLGSYLLSWIRKMQGRYYLFQN